MGKKMSLSDKMEAFILYVKGDPLHAIADKLRATKGKLQSFCHGGPDATIENRIGGSRLIDVWLRNGWSESEIEVFVKTGEIPEGKRIPQ